MTPAARLSFPDIWRATLDTAGRDFGVYAAIVAAFGVWPALALAVLGPEPGANPTAISGTMLGLQGVVAAIGAVAQLAVARLVLTGGTPREALFAGLRAVPRLLVAAFATALALVPSFALLQAAQSGYRGLALPALIVLVPAAYAIARLALALPLIAATGAGPLAALRRSWTATRGNGWRILSLLMAMLGVLLGALLLGGGVAAAVAALLTMAGGKTLGGFIVAAVTSVLAGAYALYNAVALAEMAKRLAV